MFIVITGLDRSETTSVSELLHKFDKVSTLWRTTSLYKVLDNSIFANS